MTERDKKIMEYLGESEMLSQLAEECCELGQAALKLRRVLDKKNPTPVTEEEARANLVEEAADVYNVLGFLLNAEDHINTYNIIQKKKTRWVGRLEEGRKKLMADVVAETKDFVYGEINNYDDLPPEHQKAVDIFLQSKGIKTREASDWRDKDAEGNDI